MRHFTPMQHRFIAEYMREPNATEAARRAGSKADNAAAVGHQWLHHPAVAAEIERRRKLRDERLQITEADVLKPLLLASRADPRELIALHRTACRHCHGWEFGYQRSAAEALTARREHARMQLLISDPAKRRPYDEQGGEGWDPKADPHPDCPNCAGDGVGSTRIADTRTLSPEAAALYRGVKHTANGVELVLADQDKARELLGRHLGLFRDRLEVTGKLSWESVLAVPPPAAADPLGVGVTEKPAPDPLDSL